MFLIRSVVVPLAISAAVLTGTVPSDSVGPPGFVGPRGSMVPGSVGPRGSAAGATTAPSPALAAVFPAAISRSGPLRWRWPIEPAPRVIHRFQIGPEPWSPGHRGVDLAASAGTRIRAPADGVVTFTGMVAGRPVISIKHGPTLISSLEPVRATVRRGQRISAGDLVGILSPIPGHCPPRACLHWGVRAAGRYIDPLALVGAAIGPIILLPDRPDYAQPWRR